MMFCYNLSISMDALKSFVLWPFVTSACYLRFIAGCLIAGPSIGFDFCCGGKRLGKFVDLWKLLNSFPFGSNVFSGIAAFYAPYTSSIYPTVTDLTKSTCSITISDYPWLRNPFGSIHAVALANLGEFASGLCMISSLQYRKDLRGIPTKIEMEYFKKARGVITARGSADIEVTTSLPHAETPKPHIHS